MSSPPPAQPTEPAGTSIPSGLAALFDRLRHGGITRDTSLKWIQGVCAGIAARIGVDAIVVRLVFIVLMLFGGFGLLPYLIAAALLPDERGTIHAEEAIRRGRGGSVALLIVIAVILVGEFSDRRGFITGIVAIAAVWYVVKVRRAHVAPRTPSSVTPEPPQDAPLPIAPPEVSPVPSPWVPATHGLGPGRTHVPSPAYPPPVAAVPAAPRRAKLGFLGALIVLGTTVMGYGIGSKLAPIVAPSHNPTDIAIACAVGVLGVALTIVGILGRRAPGLATIALMGAMVAGVGGYLPESMRPASREMTVGDMTWTPTRSDGPEVSYSLGAGDATLDLSKLAPAPGVEPTTGTLMVVRAAVTVGDLIIIVPSGVTVRVEGRIGLGEVNHRVGAASKSSATLQEGIDFRTGYFIERPPASPTASPTTPAPGAEVVVEARLSAGSLTIVTPEDAKLTPIDPASISRSTP